MCVCVCVCVCVGVGVCGCEHNMVTDAITHQPARSRDECTVLVHLPHQFLQSLLHITVKHSHETYITSVGTESTYRKCPHYCECKYKVCSSVHEATQEHGHMSKENVQKKHVHTRTMFKKHIREACTGCGIRM